MLRRSLPDIFGHFWQPEELKNVANPGFENLKHLQNLGHFYLNAAITCRGKKVSITPVGCDRFPAGKVSINALLHIDDIGEDCVRSCLQWINWGLLF